MNEELKFLSELVEKILYNEFGLDKDTKTMRDLMPRLYAILEIAYDQGRIDTFKEVLKDMKGIKNER
jgi:hypothetical protein